MLTKKQIYIFIVIAILILLIFYILSKKKNPKIFIKDLLFKTTGIKMVDKKNEEDAREFDIIINNNDFYNKVMRNGELGLGESYMDKDWDSHNLEKTLSILKQNEENILDKIKKNSMTLLINNSFIGLLDIFKLKNTVDKSRENIKHHYDIGNDLYDKMLGKTMQYTCAYYNEPNISLDEAQTRKMTLIAKKLNLREGLEVLDIGCGFGAMAHFLATNYKVKVTGVTLSENQKKYADKNYAHPNVNIMLKDYRNVKGKFDRVYSVGILEHIGRKNYPEYYNKCYELLKEDGIMFIHTISTIDREFYNNVSFINKYIFPEGELPHLSNFAQPHTDKWHLEDFQNIGLSYAQTLRDWHKNIGNWEGLEGYDETFRRMWDFYLLGCAGAFQVKHIKLYQFVYTKKSKKYVKDLYYIRNCK